MRWRGYRLSILEPSVKIYNTIYGNSIIMDLHIRIMTKPHFNFIIFINVLIEVLLCKMKVENKSFGCYKIDGQWQHRTFNNNNNNTVECSCQNLSFLKGEEIPGYATLE